MNRSDIIAARFVISLKCFGYVVHVWLLLLVTQMSPLLFVVKLLNVTGER